MLWQLRWGSIRPMQALRLRIAGRVRPPTEAASLKPRQIGEMSVVKGIGTADDLSNNFKSRVNSPNQPRVSQGQFVFVRRFFGKDAEGAFLR